MWNVGNGRSIKAWYDKWVPGGESLVCSVELAWDLGISLVSDLMKPGTMVWNSELINFICCPPTTREIWRHYPRMDTTKQGQVISSYASPLKLPQHLPPSLLPYLRQIGESHGRQQGYHDVKKQVGERVSTCFKFEHPFMGENWRWTRLAPVA